MVPGEYYPGDSVYINLYCAPGYVTSSGTDLFTDIFLPKPISGAVASVTLDGGLITARGDRGYIIGSASDATSMQQLNIREINPQGTHVRLIINSDTAYACTNNTPVTSYISGLTLHFNR